MRPSPRKLLGVRGRRVSTATSGRAREYKVRDHLINHGWHLVSRSAGSKGAADLVMVSPIDGVALVQVGTGNKHLGPGARARLCHLANLCSAVPLLATVAAGRITYWHITENVPSTWKEYIP